MCEARRAGGVEIGFAGCSRKGESCAGQVAATTVKNSVQVAELASRST